MKLRESVAKRTKIRGNFAKTSKASPKVTCLIVQALVSLCWCRGREEDWIKIQANTFKNWINVNLRETGLTLEDLSTDFSDGVRCVTAQFFSVAFLMSLRLLILLPVWKTCTRRCNQGQSFRLIKVYSIQALYIGGT